MSEPSDSIADGFLNPDLASCGPFHFFDDIRGNIQALKALLNNGAFPAL